jgi:hypothetical protein
MLRRLGRNVFFLVIYLSGITIGLIYTPSVVSYAKQFNAQQFDQEQIEQKPEKSRKTNQKSRQVV